MSVGFALDTRGGEAGFGGDSKTGLKIGAGSRFLGAGGVGFGAADDALTGFVGTGFLGVGFLADAVLATGFFAAALTGFFNAGFLEAAGFFAGAFLGAGFLAIAICGSDLL